MPDNLQDDKMRDEDMKLSIVYTNYNGLPYLKPCLEPLLSMLTDECECIIVDDGSTDGSRETLAEYAGRAGVSLVLKGHSGVSATRNAGLARACGEYVTFIDGDDTLREHIIPELLAAIDRKADLYIFGIERADALLGESEYSTLDDHVFEHAYRFADSYIRHRAYLIYSASNKLYRRDILVSAGISFDETMSFGEDRIFNYDYLPHCETIITSSQVMLRYFNWHVPSASTKRIERYRENALYLHRRKIECFLALAKETTQEERDTFCNLDYQQELKLAAAHELSYGMT